MKNNNMSDEAKILSSLFFSTNKKIINSINSIQPK